MDTTPHQPIALCHMQASSAPPLRNRLRERAPGSYSCGLGLGAGFLLAAILSVTQALALPLGLWWPALAQAHGHDAVEEIRLLYPMRDAIGVGAEWMLKQLPGINHVEIELTWEPSWEPSRMSQAARFALGFV